MTPRQPKRLSPRRRILFTIVLVCGLLALLEGFGYGATRVLTSYGIFYEGHASWQEYQQGVDPDLGWPSEKTFGGAMYDAIGARNLPACRDPHQPAVVSLYGDSFTWSDTVGRENAWANVLARRFKARVHNFGVRGYGTDQAYLRFKLNTQDDAPVAVLCHMSENILRNLNRLRGLLYPEGSALISPRFLLDDNGDLVLVPLPTITGEHDFDQLIANPEDHLDHEYFLPGGPAGVIKASFPFSLSLLRVLGHFRLANNFSNAPWFSPFYAPDHDGHGLQITAQILRAFVAEARARDKQPLVVILPHGRDLEYFAADGKWSYDPLLAELGDELPLLDTGPGIIAIAKERGLTFEDLFTHGDVGGHPNAAGYAVIAELVGDELVRRGLVHQN